MPRQDNRYLDAIDRALDGEGAIDELDSATRTSVNKLRSMASATPMSSGWRTAMETSQTPGIVFIPEDSYRTPRLARRANARTSFAASAAILLAIVVIAAVVIAGGNSPNGNVAGVAAVASPSTDPSSCIQEPRNQPYPPTYDAGSVITAERYRRTASVAPVNIDVVKQSELPTGDQVDDVTYNQVFQAISERMACRNAGAFNWNDLVLAESANPAPPFVMAKGVEGSLPGTIAWRGASPVPSILRMDDLGDGNIGVMFSTNFFDHWLGQYDVYRAINGQWALVDTTFYNPDSLVDSTGPADIPVHGEMVMWDIYLTPNILFLQSNETVRITVRNLASESYILRIPELDVWVYVESGATADVELKADPGVYQIEMVQPGVTDPVCYRQLRLAPQEHPAIPVS
jgi:hypothetical protein